MMQIDCEVHGGSKLQKAATPLGLKREDKEEKLEQLKL
jgi:hypothetical protein